MEDYALLEAADGAADSGSKLKKKVARLMPGAAKLFRGGKFAAKGLKARGKGSAVAFGAAGGAATGALRVLRGRARAKAAAKGAGKPTTTKQQKPKNQPFKAFRSWVKKKFAKRKQKKTGDATAMVTQKKKQGGAFRRWVRGIRRRRRQ